LAQVIFFLYVVVTTKKITRYCGLQGAECTVQVSPSRPKTNEPYQGIVITGGHDVDPVLYAQEPAVEPRYDSQRDEFESTMIQRAMDHHLPLLGICRGTQLLNVNRGGSLHQELRSRRQHTPNRWSVLPIKHMTLKTDSQLYQIMGRDHVRINSLHNQGIDRLGDNLVVSARDRDDIIQAIESDDHDFLIGVQWHPEFMVYSRPQQQLFHHLVQAARSQPAS
jgi:putative glutamine amidotransferase